MSFKDGKIRIVMGDPSGTLEHIDDPNIFDINYDPFGFVGIELNLIKKRIQVKLARQFKNTNFPTVAGFINTVREKIKPDFIGLETNNRGGEILKLFNGPDYNLNLKGVSTSANLSYETMQTGYSMDKNITLQWFKEQKDYHNILFTRFPTKDMKELFTQVQEIKGFMQLSGHTSFKRIKGRHDDLFMALLLCCHMAIIYMKRYDELK